MQVLSDEHDRQFESERIQKKCEVNCIRCDAGSITRYRAGPVALGKEAYKTIRRLISGDD